MMITNTDDPNFHNFWPKLETIITDNSKFEMPQLSIADALSKAIPFLKSQEINEFFYDYISNGDYFVNRPAINDIAYHLGEQDQKTKGIEVLKINTEMFPEHYAASFYYAEGLEELEDFSKALIVYKNA